MTNENVKWHLTHFLAHKLPKLFDPTALVCYKQLEVDYCCLAH